MRRRSGEWEQSGRSGPTAPPGSVLAGPFYFPRRPVLCPVCPRRLFQDCPPLSDVIQPGGTRSSFQCPTDRWQLRACWGPRACRSGHSRSPGFFLGDRWVREDGGGVPGVTGAGRELVTQMMSREGARQKVTQETTEYGLWRGAASIPSPSGERPSYGVALVGRRGGQNSITYPQGFHRNSQHPRWNSPEQAPWRQGPRRWAAQGAPWRRDPQPGARPLPPLSPLYSPRQAKISLLWWTRPLIRGD